MGRSCAVVAALKPVNATDANDFPVEFIRADPWSWFKCSAHSSGERHHTHPTPSAFNSSFVKVADRGPIPPPLRHADIQISIERPKTSKF